MGLENVLGLDLASMLYKTKVYGFHIYVDFFAFTSILALVSA